MGAVSPPLSPRLPPPFVAGSPPCTCRTSVLMRRGHGCGSRHRLCFADKDDFLHSAERIIQDPCPVTVSTHSLYRSRRRELTVKVGGGVLPAADGVAVRQVASHSRLPPGALPLPPILRPNSYFTLGGESWGGGSLGWQG